MISPHVFYQLILFALLGLVVIVHLTRPTRPVTAPATPTEEPEPLKPTRHRSNAPQPFEGLPHKPHCALCERDSASPHAPPRVLSGDPWHPLPRQAGGRGSQWLGEAAEQLRAFAAYFLCDLPLEQRQPDALSAVLRNRKAGEISDEEARQRLERSPYWGWTAMAPQRTLLVVVDGGSRTLAMAQRVLQQVTEVVAPGGVPLLLTAGRKDYATALRTQCGHWRQPGRRQERGPMPKPRWLPLPALLSAQGVQSYRRRRLVEGTHRVVCGTRLAIEQG